MIKDVAQDSAAAAIAQKVAVGGGVGAVFLGWTISELAGALATIVAIVGLIVQVYYKRRADKRDAAYKSELLQLLRSGASPASIAAVVDRTCGE